MKILFAGTPTVAATALSVLTERGFRPEVVLSRPDAPIGRKRVLTPSDTAQQAEALDIPIIKTTVIDESLLSDPVFQEHQDFDLGVVVAFGGFVRDPLLSQPKYGWINLHFSDLPAYRGAAPVQRALYEGNENTALTVFQLVEAMDSGPILARKPIHFLPNETSNQALERFATIGAELLADTVQTIQDGTSVAIDQSGIATFAPKFVRGEELLDSELTVQEFMARFRGLTSEPGAVIEHLETRIKIIEASGVDVPLSEASQGTLMLHDKKVLYKVSDGFVQFVRVQPAGKNVMNAADWFRGLPTDTAEQK